MERTERALQDVSEAELKVALEKLCQTLGIRSTLPAVYDLYAAVWAEWKRARDYVYRLNIGDD
jgi:hypothetical protein